MTKRNTKGRAFKALKSLNRHPSGCRAPGSRLSPSSTRKTSCKSIRDAASRESGWRLQSRLRRTFGLSAQRSIRLKRRSIERACRTVPRRRGPKGAHKLTAQIMVLSSDDRSRIRDSCAGAGSGDQAQLKLSVHPRSNRNAPCAEKKTPDIPPDERAPAALLTYEQIRAECSTSSPSRWTWPRWS